MFTKHMKKLVFILTVLIIIISGCVGSKSRVLIQEENEKMDKIQEENYFDKSRWEPDVGCTYFQGICTDKQGTIRYIPSNDVLYINPYSFRLDSKYDIVYTYLNYYVFNDYIFDLKYGNNLDDFFAKMGNNSIKFYIGEIQPLYSEKNDFKLTDSYSYVCQPNESITNEEIDPYIQNGENLEKLDYALLLEKTGCKPQVLVYLDENNLKENKISKKKIENESTEYYNSDKVILKFKYLEGGDNIIDDEHVYNVIQHTGDETFEYTNDTLDSDETFGELGDWSDRYNF